jgi:hypothetical protein
VPARGQIPVHPAPAQRNRAKGAGFERSQQKNETITDELPTVGRVPKKRLYNSDLERDFDRRGQIDKVERRQVFPADHRRKSDQILYQV